MHFDLSRSIVLPYIAECIFLVNAVVGSTQEILSIEYIDVEKINNIENLRSVSLLDSVKLGEKTPPPLWAYNLPLDIMCVVYFL